MKIKNSPYNLRETLGYFKRNFLGPVTKNRGLVDYCPQCIELNTGVEPRYEIAFIGDIMDMAGRRLLIGEGVKQFIQSSDWLIGNFEATITEEKGAIMAQRHIPQILEALAELFPPENTALGLANNHSGDFGFEIWSNSKQQIEARGFHLFGFADLPYIDIDDTIRIVGATQWSNQPINYLVKLEDVLQVPQRGGFNILYPHWGYELELFPRPEIVEAAKRLSQSFDAILGHHSHIPQPVTSYSADKPGGTRQQVIAYGLGDFCIFERLNHYTFGQVVKLTIGPQTTGEWKTGRLEWRFVHCQPVSDDAWEVEITSDFPYATR